MNSSFTNSIIYFNRSNISSTLLLIIFLIGTSRDQPSYSLVKLFRRLVLKQIIDKAARIFGLVVEIGSM